MAKKYAAKRAAIFAVINDANATDEARFEARLKLQSIPRNAAPVRQRRRCALTGTSARRVPQIRFETASKSVKSPCAAVSRA
nr:hypothetical protein LVJ77_07330 [Conchiformibius kuhniae]